MKHLYFMRHGLSVMNQQGIFSGQNDTPLAKEGVAQCKQSALAVRNIKFDAIISSPMKRALDSAKIIAKAQGFPEDKILISELFMERDFGPLEGTTYAKLSNLDDIEGVEPSSSLISRAQAGLKLITSLHADTILVVGHGAIGRALRHVITPSLDYKNVEGFNNAEVVKLV